MSNNHKSPVTIARLHIAEAHTKYGGTHSSETLFRAHVTAANFILTGDRDGYIDYCKRNGIRSKEKWWNT